jgi:hypothetical protein
MLAKAGTIRGAATVVLAAMARGTETQTSGTATDAQLMPAIDQFLFCCAGVAVLFTGLILYHYLKQ